MAIPDYQTIMLPLLKHLSDEQEKSTRETLESLADEFNLIEEEKNELLSSGQQSVFMNRIAWAKVYLKKAELIESNNRGYFKITRRGLKTIEKNPDKIDNKYLTQFMEFRDFLKNKSKKKSGAKDKNSETEELEMKKTPEEYLEFGYQKLRDEL